MSDIYCTLSSLHSPCEGPQVQDGASAVSMWGIDHEEVPRKVLRAQETPLQPQRWPCVSQGRYIWGDLGLGWARFNLPWEGTQGKTLGWIPMRIWSSWCGPRRQTTLSNYQTPHVHLTLSNFPYLIKPLRISWPLITPTLLLVRNVAFVEICRLLQGVQIPEIGSHQLYSLSLVLSD